MGEREFGPDNSLVLESVDSWKLSCLNAGCAESGGASWGSGSVK